MQAVFFEMRPKAGHLAHYFDHVARLKPVLAAHKDMMFLDRYMSLTNTDELLSHQLWESEAAIAAWREDAEHRRSQAVGRHVHFDNYRIRVGLRVWHWEDGKTEVAESAASSSRSQHIVALYSRQPIAAPSFSVFESVNTPGKFVSIASMDGVAPAYEEFRRYVGSHGTDAAAVYAIARDYGLFDRAQAPD
jgi:Antibiotic biosynthesis monooxygenase